MDGASLDISMIESCFIDIMKGQNVLLLLACQLLAAAARPWSFVSQPFDIDINILPGKRLKIIQEPSLLGCTPLSPLCPTIYRE